MNRGTHAEGRRSADHAVPHRPCRESGRGHGSRSQGPDSPRPPAGTEGPEGHGAHCAHSTAQRVSGEPFARRAHGRYAPTGRPTRDGASGRRATRRFCTSAKARRLGPRSAPTAACSRHRRKCGFQPRVTPCGTRGRLPARCRGTPCQGSQDPEKAPDKGVASSQGRTAARRLYD